MSSHLTARDARKGSVWLDDHFSYNLHTVGGGPRIFGVQLAIYVKCSELFLEKI